MLLQASELSADNKLDGASLIYSGGHGVQVFQKEFEFWLNLNDRIMPIFNVVMPGDQKVTQIQYSFWLCTMGADIFPDSQNILMIFWGALF